MCINSKILRKASKEFQKIYYQFVSSSLIVYCMGQERNLQKISTYCTYSPWDCVLPGPILCQGSESYVVSHGVPVICFQCSDDTLIPWCGVELGDQQASYSLLYVPQPLLPLGGHNICMRMYCSLVWSQNGLPTISPLSGTIWDFMLMKGVKLNKHW